MYINVIVTDNGQSLPLSGQLSRSVLLRNSSDHNFAPLTASLPTYVRVSLNPSGRAFIELLDQTISTACFQEIIRLLIMHHVSHTVIEHGPGDIAETFWDLDTTVARLNQLQDTPLPTSWQDHFHCVSLSLQRLTYPERRKLATIHKRWKTSRGRLSADRAELDGHGLGIGQHSLVRMADADHAVVEAWANHIARYPEQDCLAMQGRLLEEQPDPEFGAFVAEGYYAVARSSEPALDLLEGIVCLPGPHVRRVRYERLLLPWRDQNGCQFVSGTSLMRLERPA